MAKFTIKDLELGKCAVINDGTLEQLREVIKLAFPNSDQHLAGAFRFYFPPIDINKIWECSDDTDQPTQSVKDFLEAETTRTISVEQSQKIFDFAEVCTSEQFEVFNKAFCESKHVIYDERLKVGSIVKIKLTLEGIDFPSDINLTKPFDIVILNSPYIILGSEFREGDYEKQITLHQNGRYCSFCSDENLDFITEVIEY